MNDETRELLQLAADACGLLYDPTRKAAHGLWVVRPGARYQEDQVLWNPLTQTHDLWEVQLRLRISIDFTDCCALHRSLQGNLIQEFWGGDCHPDEATAILHVAAELGRQKGKQ